MSRKRSAETQQTPLNESISSTGRSRRKSSKSIRHGKEQLNEGGKFYVPAMKIVDLNLITSPISAAAEVNEKQYCLIQHCAGENTETGAWQFQILSPSSAAASSEKFVLPADILLDSQLTIEAEKGESILNVNCKEGSTLSGINPQKDRKVAKTSQKAAKSRKRSSETNQAPKTKKQPDSTKEITGTKVNVKKKMASKGSARKKAKKESDNSHQEVKTESNAIGPFVKSKISTPKFPLQNGDYRQLINSVVLGTEKMGNFAAGGKISADIGTPPVEIKGVGRVAYPLCPEQACTIISKAELAPFGKGTETVVDPSVRKVWQIDASKVKIGSVWAKKSLPKIVRVACNELGLDQDALKIEAHFFKFLLYEKGGHFKRHTDTEKEDGMFGTLLVQLPAQHTGGELVVEHMQERKTLSFSKNSADECFFSTFYSDCDHKLEPIKSGFRMVLCFNLVRLSEGIIEAPSGWIHHHTALNEATNRWMEDMNGPTKLAVKLDHKYSQANLKFSSLKGRDKQVVEMLQSAVSEDGKPLFRIHLVIQTKHVTGEPDDGGYGYKKSRKMADECARDDSTDFWVSPEGPAAEFNPPAPTVNSTWACFGRRANPVGGLDVDLASEFLFNKIECERWEDGIDYAYDEDMPDEQEYEGYQGNYAGALEYWYHSALVVIWPPSLEKYVQIDNAGFDKTLKSYLEHHSSDLLKSSPNKEGNFQPTLDELITFACKKPSLACPFRLLPICSSPEQACTLLQRASNYKGITPGSAQHICDATKRFGWDKLGPQVLECLRKDTSQKWSDSVSASLDLVSTFFKESMDFAEEAARILIQSIFENNDPKFFHAQDLGKLLSIITDESDALVSLMDSFLSFVAQVSLVTLERLLESKHIADKVAKDVNFLKVAALLIPALRREGSRSSNMSYLSLNNNNKANDDIDASEARKVASMLLSCESNDLLNNFKEMMLESASTQCLQGFLRDARYDNDYKIIIGAIGKGTQPLCEICRALIDRLSNSCPQEPVFSYKMTGASVPSDPAFEQFLHSDLKTFVKEGFTGIKEARKWANRIVKNSAGCSWSSSFKLSDKESFSVVCVEKGSGQKAKLEISKTKDLFTPLLHEFQNAKAEIARLEGYLRSATAENKENDNGSASSPKVKSEEACTTTKKECVDI